MRRHGSAATTLTIEPGERLSAAAVAVAAREGYHGLTVGGVARGAGVSRTTFYCHFTDKDSCLLAGYRERVSDLRDCLAEAVSGIPPAERPRALLEGLLGWLSADPDAARLLLVEAPAASPEIREEHQRTLAAIERLLEASASAGAGPPLAVPATALLGGVLGVLAIRVLDGEGRQLQELGEELLAWVESYRCPQGQGPRGGNYWAQLGRRFPPAPAHPLEPVRLLPRGRHALPGATAAMARRSRILAAFVRLSARSEYGSITVADISAEARVTRATFYSHFRGKEEAFLAAQTEAMQQSVALTAAQYSLTTGWPDGIWLALDALLGHLSREPELARLGLLGALAAGEKAIRNSYRNQRAHALFLEDGYRLGGDDAAPTRLTSEAVPAAVAALMRHHLLAGQSNMRWLLPVASCTVLAPFLGAAAALEFIEARCQTAR